MTESPFRTPTGLPVPAVTADDMREVDRFVVQDIGMDLLQMMENTGRTFAWHAVDVREGPVLVLAGGGGNGGGGLACARHLANHGVPVEVVLDRDPAELTGAAAKQFSILQEADISTGVGIERPDRNREFEVVVDALIGYGLQEMVREPVRGLIEDLNDGSAKVVSLDVPSGIDATTGVEHGVAVRPNRTVTLALPKTGLVDRPEPLYLADIGIPPMAYQRLDIKCVNPFGRRPWVELHAGNGQVTG